MLLVEVAPSDIERNGVFLRVLFEIILAFEVALRLPRSDRARAQRLGFVGDD